MKGRQQIALFAAVYLVPEGQHDSNQARSAWSHEENIPVPGGTVERISAQISCQHTFKRNTWHF